MILVIHTIIFTFCMMLSIFIHFSPIHNEIVLLSFQCFWSISCHWYFCVAPSDYRHYIKYLHLLVQKVCDPLCLLLFSLYTFLPEISMTIWLSYLLHHHTRITLLTIQCHVKENYICTSEYYYARFSDVRIFLCTSWLILNRIFFFFSSICFHERNVHLIYIFSGFVFVSFAIFFFSQ